MKDMTIADMMTGASPVKTPMPIKTAESTPKSNEAAVSTPAEIDLVLLVESVAKRKASIGESFSGKKGKSSLFSGVCSAYRSAMGLPKFTEDGRPAQLADVHVASINDAITEFWQSKLNDLGSFGQVTSYRKNYVIAKVKEDGTVNLKYGAKMTAERKCGENTPGTAIGEYHLAALDRKKAAEKRMDYMLENMDKFDRDELSRQRFLIESFDKASKLASLPEE